MTPEDAKPRRRWWRIRGSYYEVCSCEAVCPCRRVDGRMGGVPSYATCDFALSWHIEDGVDGTLDLSDLNVVLAGSYSVDEPDSPWRVVLYVDELARQQQRDALTDIFLGRAGGQTLHNFARAIGEVYTVRTARIALDHTPSRERIHVPGRVTAETARLVPTAAAVSCGIPGHDRPGQEVVAATFSVDDEPLSWDLKGRCGFATDFDYRADG